VKENSLSFRLLIAAGCVFSYVAVALAQAPGVKTSGVLRPPDHVVLYIHSAFKNAAFVEPLVCALRRVLIAPVEVEDIDLPLGRDLLASPTQFDVAKIAGRVVAATAAEGGARTFKYFLHPYDMKDGQFRYVFATSYGDTAPFPYYVGVVSMARLEMKDAGVPRARRAEISAARAYKLILKSIGVGAGLPDRGGCVLAFPRSLEELDQKPSEFCPADHEALVVAKVLKAQESAGCVYVSENR
jgi:predicted Zn-dependent protease